MAVYQGDVDTAVFPAATKAYVDQACASGAAISYTTYPDVDHLTLAAAARPQFVPWIADRFAGKPAPSTCP